jgi:MFS family permease
MTRTDAPNSELDAAPASRPGFSIGPTTVPPGDTSESQVSELAEESRPDDRPSRLGVLRHRHFRNIWIAAFGSSIGSWMEITGVQWAMATTTLEPAWVAAGKPSAPIMAGYLAVAQMAPTLVFGLIGGVAADRVNRKNLLLFTQFLLMLVAVALCVATFTGHLTPWFLVVLGAINGVIMAFNIPAWQVLTPRLVPREELTAAVTLNGIQFNLARVIGPALGGLLMHQYGAGVLFAINALSFLGVLLAIFGTPRAPAPPRDGTNAWEQSKEAVLYVFTRRGPLVLIAAISLFSMLGTPMLRMLPILVHEVYHAQEDVYGWMLSALGVGAVGGGLLMRYIPRWYPKHHLIPLAITGAGVSITILSACESWKPAFGVMIVVGVFWLLSFNPAFAALQLLVEDRIRGRVMAICNMISFGAMPVGSLMAGGVSILASGSGDNAFGTQVGVGVLSLALTICGLVMLTWRTPEVDGIKPGEPGYAQRPGLLRGILADAHRPAQPGAAGSARRDFQPPDASGGH